MIFLPAYRCTNPEIPEIQLTVARRGQLNFQNLLWGHNRVWVFTTNKGGERGENGDTGVTPTNTDSFL